MSVEKHWKIQPTLLVETQWKIQLTKSKKGALLGLNFKLDGRKAPWITAVCTGIGCKQSFSLAFGSL
jgi:hypothetical protein